MKSFRASGALAIGLFAVFGLAGCEGETLYNDNPLDPMGPLVLAPHAVALLSASIPPRMEDREEMVFTVQATAQTGKGEITAIGLGARVTGARLTSPALVRLVEVAVTGGTGLVTRELRVSLGELRRLLPTPTPVAEELLLEVSAYALHSSGACVAATGPALQQLPCTLVDGVSVGSVGGAVVAVQSVAGSTIPFPTGMTQAGDLVIHNGSGQLFVSNRAGHTVEVLQLNAPGGPAFRTSGVPVGSQPWGMNLNRTGDTLIVANSGGTSFSYVAVGSLQERRADIPRISLHNYTIPLDAPCTLSFLNFTDRPQYVTQDRNGRLLYSAASSPVNELGSIRLAEVPAGRTALNAKMLFPGTQNGIPISDPPLESRGVTLTDFGYAIANVDSMISHVVSSAPVASGPTCLVTLFDHLPGTSQTIRIGPFPASRPNIDDAIVQLFQAGSDVIAFPGWHFELAALETSDTTFVAASGNRDFVAFGEGAKSPDSRVTLWSSANLLSRTDDMADLMNNSSDRLTAIDLNSDGSIGAARGLAGTYFFDRNLRLQGTASTGLDDGAGLGLFTASNGKTFAFLGTGSSSIQVVETGHFRAVGNIAIRYPIIGPLRVGPGRSAGFGATVYAITEGGVVVLEIPTAMLQ